RQGKLTQYIQKGNTIQLGNLAFSAQKKEKAWQNTCSFQVGAFLAFRRSRMFSPSTPSDDTNAQA
ncbi:hypothetical protein L9G16_21825, partial [Shewanella sp. A25]|nr:hypothetical protein [Shewanella shenzhenensis]